MVLGPGGAGTVEVGPFLRAAKTQKYMGKQDKLAVAAAGRALAEAKLPEAWLQERVGVYLAVGYIPFERAEVEPIARDSTVDGTFAMEAFSTVAIRNVHPLLTFRCLPNMPIFHVSLNFGLQGPSFVTYPGPGQLYAALARAGRDLARGLIDAALVGAVADQQNFLVRHHYARLPQPWTGPLADVGGFLVLEARPRAGARELFRLEALDLGYDPSGPGAGDDPTHGPAGLFPWLEALRRAGTGAGAGVHGIRTRDGFRGETRWGAA